MVGKISLGYQGWFSCQNDGSNTGWLHWANRSPSPSDYFMKSWPDVREYPKTYQTGFANLGNGQPAVLFYSYDQITVNTHFRWIQENGLDTVALQRFNPNAFTNAIAPKVRAAAETYGRKFYVMYDTTYWGASWSRCYNKCGPSIRSRCSHQPDELAQLVIVHVRHCPITH